MLIAKVPELKEKELSPTRSIFTITPLEPGFGYTIGNSLRRTLLASIPGAAITSINIQSVLYEFSTIKGVVEDVTEIILNLKEVVVSSESEKPVIAKLNATKEGNVLAGDIEVPTGVHVHNKKHHIAKISKGGKLKMELVIERGRGYVPAEKNKDPNAEIGRIPIDSIYSPVLKVGYKVDSTRMQDRTDFDKLIIDVETKESISPKDAMASASGTLINLLTYIKELNEKVETVEVKEVDEFSIDLEEEKKNQIFVEDVKNVLELPQRASKGLELANIKTIEDLVNKSAEELSGIKGMGRTSTDAIEKELAKHDLTLKK